MTGVELFAADDADPCELTLSEFQDFDGRRLPRRWRVDHAGKTFAELVVEKWTIDEPPLPAPKGEN